ncbi:hypothetical protein OH76DRAFT_1410356 [Lentinus brumalis]|uniref:Uncharacterized protein n=1 Tax=Lentinus brumalis TaxID=2498619 RepID=A0A371CSI9_9APHY|nr:hypothetical protein OH76DRAFT_1410356 [Polyporus brumalis]
MLYALRSLIPVSWTLAPSSFLSPLDPVLVSLRELMLVVENVTVARGHIDRFGHSRLIGSLHGLRTPTGKVGEQLSSPDEYCRVLL